MLHQYAMFMELASQVAAVHEAITTRKDKYQQHNGLILLTFCVK
jgi:predicted hotdog family 3-hydroxylacyl-ACP dehydratase